MLVSEYFEYRTLCIYFDNNWIGCILFYGNGKYITHRKDVMFGVTDYLQEHYDEHSDLIDFILYNKSYITEDEFKNKVNKISQYKIGVSERYRYPFHRKMQDVFNTFSKNNQLIDVRKIVR